MNSHTECERFDIKSEKDSVSVDGIKAEPQNIKNEVKTEAFESNVFSECIDIKNETIPISELVASTKTISENTKSEINTEVEECDYFSELFDNKQEASAISNDFSSIKTKLEVEDTQEGIDSFIQDEKNVHNQKNNSEEVETNCVPKLNESSTTYETDFEEEKCDHTEKKTCVHKNYSFEHNNLNVCRQRVSNDLKCKNGNKSSSKSNFTKLKGGKHFSCNICSKSFPNKQNLARHTVCHIAEKPFICSNCNKSFSWKHHLQRHMRVHSGEKPFMCDICSKSFTRKHYLNLHVFIHVGEKTFGCDKCSSTFRTRSDLKRHSRMHTGEKPFTCTLCNKSYSRRENLIEHYNVHSGKKPFACNLCSKSFYRKFYLVEHVRYHASKPLSRLLHNQCERE